MPVLQPINAATVLDKTITSEMVGGVLNEVVAVIPTIIPVAITFIAIRKGISFVLGMLRSAYFFVYFYTICFLPRARGEGKPFPLIFMKGDFFMKKIYCVIFSVMLVVFTMIPVTAFAYTGAANADYRAIASDSGIAIADDMKYYVVYTEKGKTDYVYAVFSTQEIAATSYTMNGGVYYCLKPPTGTVITVVRYSYQNIYSNPTSLNEKFSFSTSYNMHGLNPYTGLRYETAGDSSAAKNPLVPAYSNYDFDNAGTTFQQTPSTPTTPGTEGETTPGAAVLGQTFKKTNLSQVLSELIAVLPILLPVLITFIAIRKGIKFILGTLRTA